MYQKHTSRILGIQLKKFLILLKNGIQNPIPIDKESLFIRINAQPRISAPLE